MKNLIKKHYNSIVKRGLITPDTNIVDFKKKIKEEYTELMIELETNPYNKLSDEAIQESIDLISVCTNMLFHYDVDIEQELIKNILKQESRCKDM